MNEDDFEDYDTITLADGLGSLHFDRDALAEAAFKWRRKEKREALYQLEKALGGHFEGLADLRPEDLQ